MNRYRPALALLGALLAALLSGCSRERPLPPPGTPPDVVLIVIDTARADRLSTYGYGRETSPNLDALAQEGRTFERARSTSTWTAPAHASMFTGLYPGAHQTTQESWTLPDGIPTLAEELAARGYATAGVTSNPMLTAERGFARGFEHYDEPWRGATFDPDIRALAHLQQLVADLPSPYFLFVNLIGPHAPYTSCGPECNRWARGGPEAPDTTRWPDYYRRIRRFSAAEFNHLGDLYDGELRRADAILGRILEELRERGRIDDTLIIVTSDHGENIGDHGHVDHLFSLYDTTVRIPLVIRLPELFPAGTRSSAPVQLPDLFPTILAVAGADADELSNQGTGLGDEVAIADRPQIFEYYQPLHALSVVYARSTPEQQRMLDPFDRKLEAIATDRYKLIRGSDGSRELFDLIEDPAERSNLAHDQAALPVREDLEAQLDTWLARYSKDAPANRAPIEDETRPALEATGYIE